MEITDNRTVTVDLSYKEFILITKHLGCTSEDYRVETMKFTREEAKKLGELYMIMVNSI